MIVEGIMEAKLPWGLILIGVAIAIVVEILGVPVMPFAVGMYLPVSVSAGIMCGGIVRLILDKKKFKDEATKSDAIERGVLYSSGMIAGEGLIGIILAALAAGKKDIALSFTIGQPGALVVWILMLFGC